MSNVIAPDKVAVELERLYALEDDVLNNPYPLYAAIREHQPVLRVGPQVSVSRYEDVKNVLRDNETFSSDRRESSTVKARMAELTPEQKAKYEALLDYDSRIIPQMDEPQHGRMRRFVNETFSAKRIEAMRDQLFHIANTQLDQAVAKDGGRFDLIQDYSIHVPLRAICSILAVPESDAETVLAWGAEITKGIGTQFSNVDEAYEALMNFNVYVGDLIADARKHPGGEDLISQLVVATDDEGVHLTDEDLKGIFVQMLVSGNTNTLIANAVIALDRNPEQKALLLQDLTRTRPAVEEFLRYCPSIHAIHRMSVEDTEIAGFPVRKGETIRLLLASANHDDAKFERAEELDITRKNARQHVGIGYGIHTCLGQWLLRLDAEAALMVLYERHPELRITGPVQNRKTFTMHGPQFLEVEVDVR